MKDVTSNEFNDPIAHHEPRDRERVVVELWRGNLQLAEVSNEDGTLRIEIYVEPGTNRVAVAVDELEEALCNARQNLLR